MSASLFDLSKVHDALGELLARYPAQAMASVHAVLGELLELRAADEPNALAVAAAGDRPGRTGLPGHTERALRAARRLLLRFFPTSRIEPPSDDCSEEALSAYAGFADGLRAQGRHFADPAALALADLIDEWVGIVRGGQAAGDGPAVAGPAADWDLSNLRNVVQCLEQLYGRWLPSLRQQVFRVRCAS